MKTNFKRAIFISWPFLCGSIFGGFFGVLMGWDFGLLAGLVGFFCFRYLLHASNADLVKVMVLGAPAAVLLGDEIDRGIKELLKDARSLDNCR